MLVVDSPLLRSLVVVLLGARRPLPPREFHDPDIHSITHSSSCAEALFTHSTRQPAASVRLFHFHCNVCALLLPLLLPALSHLSQRAWSLAPWQLPLRERASSCGDGGNRTRDCCMAAWHANTLATPHPQFSHTASPKKT